MQDYMRPLRSMQQTLSELRAQQKLLKAAARFDEDLWCRVTVLTLEIFRRQRSLAKACEAWFDVQPERFPASLPKTARQAECADSGARTFNQSIEWRFAAERDKRLRQRAARAQSPVA